MKRLTVEERTWWFQFCRLWWAIGYLKVNPWIERAL